MFITHFKQFEQHLEKQIVLKSEIKPVKQQIKILLKLKIWFEQQVQLYTNFYLNIYIVY